MPRFPRFASRVGTITGSVFEQYRERMKTIDDLVRLHIGDTYLGPSYDLPFAAGFKDKYPGFNKYCSTFGVEPLRAALQKKLVRDNGLPIEEGGLMITNGASNALSISAMSLMEPGDEVLVLTPCWPFFRGMVRMSGAVPVEVPFYMELYEEAEMDVADLIEEYVTEHTVAVYLNSPNNPSGKMLSRRQLEQVGEIARKNDLWVISDEAYDGLTFDGNEHTSIGALDDLFERTISVFTFSKIFMFAGIRLGYVAAGRETLLQLNKAMVHQVYSPSTLGQYLMVRPVETAKDWLPDVREHYREMRDRFLGSLNIRCHRPEGAYFVFFSVNDYLQGREPRELFERCLNAGVSVAPGNEFGGDFGDYFRLCFTGESPERMEVAAERLNRVFKA